MADKGIDHELSRRKPRAATSHAPPERLGKQRQQIGQRADEHQARSRGGVERGKQETARQGEEHEAVPDR